MTFSLFFSSELSPGSRRRKRLRRRLDLSIDRSASVIHPTPTGATKTLADRRPVVLILFAVVLADIVGRIALQVWGFIGCAVGLFLASLSGFFADGEQLLLIFAGFMLFNFMTNLGPNAQTYLLAGEVFPTAIRGKGASFAAAFAKIGAVTTAFLFPILLDSIGTQALLYCLIVTSLLGAAITWLFRIETTGVSLENLHGATP